MSAAMLAALTARDFALSEDSISNALEPST